MVNIDVDKVESTVILTVNGRVNMQTSHLLLAKIKDAMPKTERLLINLEAVDYMDSSGVGILVTALKSSRESGTRLQLSGLNERVLAVMEMSGLTRLFEIFPDNDGALAADPT